MVKETQAMELTMNILAPTFLILTYLAIIIVGLYYDWIFKRIDYLEKWYTGEDNEN